MSNQHRCVFHQMRAQAERQAADRATCELTRALHLQLAELHSDAAWEVQLLMRKASSETLTYQFVDQRRPARERSLSHKAVTG